MTATFIYSPTTGDRIFVAVPCPSVFKFQWANRSSHVVGGVHLTLRPQGSREVRQIMTTLVTQVVQQHGGVGWDEQGCIQAIVAPSTALLLDKLCRSLVLAGGQLGRKLDLADLGPQLFLHGLARVTEDGRFESVGWAEDPVVEVLRASQDEDHLTIETTAGTVKVPASWSQGLDVSGPWGAALDLEGEGVSDRPPTDEERTESPDPPPTDAW